MAGLAIGKRLPLGFAGAISQGSDIVAVNRACTEAIAFGGAVSLASDNTVSNTQPSNLSGFIGFALRVATAKSQTQDYMAGDLVDIVTRGAVCVPFTGNTTPNAGDPVFLRVSSGGFGHSNAQMGSVTAEGGSGTIQLPNAVFRTGIVDDGLVEILLTHRRI